MQKPLSHGRYERLIIHAPHAGEILPVHREKHPMVTYYKRRKISATHNILCDHYTDKLFASTLPSVLQISFPFSRLFCDVERLINDPLEAKGLGICYDTELFIHYGYNNQVWQLTKEQAVGLYNAHHIALKEATRGGGLLLDCHSFSEIDNILCPNAHTFKDIDICLGFNDDNSKPDEDTIQFISSFFRLHGYSIAYNQPFSNAITTGRGCSLMIEVNKHCYMNEQTLQITPGYYKLHSELQELYSLLLNH